MEKNVTMEISGDAEQIMAVVDAARQALIEKVARDKKKKEEELSNMRKTVDDFMVRSTVEQVLHKDNAKQGRQKVGKKVQFQLCMNRHNKEKLDAFKEYVPDALNKLEQVVCIFLDKYEKRCGKLTEYDVIYPYAGVKEFITLAKDL